MTRILGLGDNTVDTYIDAGVQYPGGNAVNVAAMTAGLGAKSAYLGCIGSDEGGHLIQSALAAEKVETSRIRVRSGTNGRAYIGHVDGDRQFINSSPGVRADYRWHDDDFEYLKRFDHVHTTIYSDLGDALGSVSHHAKSLSFDASDTWTENSLAQVVPYVRFIFLSASHLSGADSLAVARKCLALGAEIAVLTRGSDGALGVNDDGPILQAACTGSVVDTLGAGDGFISGFLTAKMAGSPLRGAMTAGAEFAARVCGWHGAFGHGVPWTGNASDVRAKSRR
jgi:fructoselysine 6-kinase